MLLFRKYILRKGNLHNNTKNLSKRLFFTTPKFQLPVPNKLNEQHAFIIMRINYDVNHYSINSIILCTLLETQKYSNKGEHCPARKVTEYETFSGKSLKTKFLFSV